ncbi:uncharacterized protein LOC126606186 [Malus sylvestris]|uniref:uncharacterized protein LOC126606186 n=1 Tax=Malus sylvestris TaxID=3752 RepID=UPI0021ACBC24|nr:uncharacterized protein LOC126606186 [Malus sylvestris]XP_050129498.1 uncharacterized protein LOC126606186 [Malus sylvestris]
MPSQTLANANFLTSLSLEYVRLGDIINRSYDVSWDNGDPFEALQGESLFPCLKTVSLKDVIFQKQSSVFWLISACPSIKSLSLTSCSFSAATSVLNWVVVVSSSSLKTLQLMHCKARRVQVVKAINLESVTFISDISIHEILLMDKCHKLKYINISTQHLKVLRLSGIGQLILKSTIDTPNLDCTCFSGYLKPREISTNAPKVFMATITLFWDNEEPGPSSHSPSTNFLGLRDFLANFDCSKEVRLCFGDAASAEVFVRPENFGTLLPPFPRVKNCLLFDTPRSRQIEATTVDFYPSLCSMAPSAKTIRSVKFVESSSSANRGHSF